MMKRFRKKPVVIEAVQFTGDVGAPEIVALDVGCFHQVGIGDCLVIPTLEGMMKAVPGDWIIRGVAGELYPCKPDIFSATYESVEEIGNEFDAEDVGEVFAEVNRRTIEAMQRAIIAAREVERKK